MNTHRIGRCSECGGEVMAHFGAWLGLTPPPPPTCASCGAVEAASDPVIPMQPRTVQRHQRIATDAVAMNVLPPYGFASTTWQPLTVTRNVVGFGAVTP